MIVHVWGSDGSGRDTPKNPEHADEIVARLRSTPPGWKSQTPSVTMPSFALRLQQEVRCYYPHRAALVAAFGSLAQQVEESPCAVLTLALPADDLELATRLLLKTAWASVFLYFETAGMLYSWQLLEGSGPATPEALRWLRDCEKFPPLSEARQRTAEIVIGWFGPMGFAYEKVEKGDMCLVRTTAGRVEQKISLYYSMHLGVPRLAVHVTATSLDLQSVMQASWIHFYDTFFFDWARLTANRFGGSRIPLYTWDDVLDILGYLQREVMPLLDHLDSLQALDAHLDGRLLPQLAHGVPHYDRRIATARLAANPDYERLRQEIQQTLAGKTAAEAEPVFRLIAYLDTLPLGTLPEVRGTPEAPPFDKEAMLKRAEGVVRKQLSDLGFKKKPSSSHCIYLERSVGELRQAVHLSFRRGDHQWGFCVGIHFHAKAVEAISRKAGGFLANLGGFRWQLNGMTTDDYIWFSTWAEFEACFAECGAQVRHFLEGIDSLAAIQDAFYRESSPRYDPKVFEWNKYEALMVAAVLGGPEEAGIAARVRAMVAGMEDANRRSIEKDQLKSVDRAVKKMLGKVPAGMAK